MVEDIWVFGIVWDCWVYSLKFKGSLWMDIRLPNFVLEIFILKIVYENF